MRRHSTFERYTDLIRKPAGKALANALKLWCPLDSGSKQPRALGGEIHARFSVAHDWNE